MRLQANNALVQINALKDFDQAMKVAEKMVADSQEGLVIVEADDCEGVIVMSSVWNHFQKQEWVDAYKAAKAGV